MIAGCVHGAGGARLGAHNAAPQEADEARPGESRGLVAEGISDQIAELSDLARASGQKAPLRHVHASPPPGADWGAGEWSAYWSLYERALGLQRCPFSEAVHDKPGPDGRPPHRHRVYLALTERGTLVRTGWDYAAQEAVSRIVEHDTGSALVKGAHNVRALRVLTSLAREDVAEAMRAAGLLDGARARADLSPAARLQEERTGVSKSDMARLVATAWTSADTGPAFAAALRDVGLVLAEGDKCPVVIDRTGNVHSVTRMLTMAARADGGPAPRAADVSARLAGMDLPTVAIARRAAPEVPPPAPGGMPLRAAPAADPGGAAVPPSRDGAASASVSASSLGGGGGSAPSSSGDGERGASLEDAGEGPGEPPGPNATPDERARFMAKVAAYEDRKAAAWARWVAAQARPAVADAPAHHGGGNENGLARKEDVTTDLAAASHGAPARAGRGGILVAAPVGRDSRRPSGAGQRDTRRGERCAGNSADGGQFAGGTRAAVGGGGVRPRRGEEALAGHDGTAGQHRRAAGRSRIEAVRAARGLAALNVGELRDRLADVLHPLRCLTRALDAAAEDVARQRAAAPHADPSRRDGVAMAQAAVVRLHDEQRARLTAADEAQSAVACARSRLPQHVRVLAALGWTSPRQAEVDVLVEEARASAAAARFGTPTHSTIDAAKADAHTLADHHERAFQSWRRTAGRELDVRETAIEAVRDLVRRGDHAIVDAFRTDGTEAVIRRQEWRVRSDEAARAQADRVRESYGPQRGAGARGPWSP